MSSEKNTAQNLEQLLERTLFKGRWLLAPFFLGLMFAVVLLLIKFFKQLYVMTLSAFSESGNHLLVGILTLVDTALLAGLLLIIIFSGYENFVSKLDIDDHEDRPAWMGKVGFSGLKIKLISAIVAISAVELLKVFISSQDLTNTQLGWKVGIHLTFVISGVLFSITDYINSKTKSH
ncbi:TIGR00645 family protein [Pseudoalteromonas xiamenensis]|uniref:TIGR00645 family protein n=1 Tax=Pseudoalteromonas xiamenensis TaxID=882626 RepID=UPI0027E43987|nr:TIGR00645 family protein [Pseudoalteromonas xiamenensis]WMN60265.1 TIGR00645 family protein [Pseudoalteromonas xiamenensis]